MPLVSQLNLIFCLRYTTEPDGATLVGGNDILVNKRRYLEILNPTDIIFKCPTGVDLMISTFKATKQLQRELGIQI